MKNIVYITSFIVMVHLILPSLSASYVQFSTHPLINESALNLSDTDSYMKNQLGFPNGTSTWFGKNKAVDWIKQGGTDEDNNVRGIFHFHDPTKSWANAGILGLGFSSLDWAQDNTVGPVPTCADLSAVGIPCPEPPPSSNPDRSWPGARKYLYEALTATDTTTREQNFANAFKYLGHVMHLLADAAVPEHARNDSHLFGGSRYEKWAEEPGASSGLLSSFIAQNYMLYPVDYSEVTSQSNVPGYNPISNFWDATPTPGYGGTLLGLAEYTNYNFLSPDTIFKTYTYPVNPQTSKSYLEVVKDKDAQSDDLRVYFSGTTSDSQSIKHLVSTGYLWADLEKVSPYTMDSAKFVLDENCYNDYASILVPKAVNYSASLLDYFFRGQISITPDSNAEGQYIIHNSSPEEMTGSFSLYYDDASDNRTKITSWENLTIHANSQSTPVTFTVPTDPKEKDRYILVFQGTMGNEQGAIVGKVVKWWREEWDNDLQSNHSWLYSGKELQNNSQNGQIQNTVADGKLIKDNVTAIGEGNINQNLVRGPFYEAPVAAPYPGSPSPSYCTDPAPGHRYCMDSACNTCFSQDYGKEFPLSINKNTWLSLKIDAMTKDVPASCSGWSEGAHQGVILAFAVGPDQWEVQVNFTLAGNETRLVNQNYAVPQGTDYSANIYELLSPVVQLVEPISLYSIEVVQWIHCGSPGIASQQHLEVDYIRVMDR